MALQVVKIREFIGHTQAVYTICKDSKEDFFFSSGSDGMIVHWNIKQSDGVLIAKEKCAVYSVYADTDYLISGCIDGTISVFNKDFELQKKLQLSDKPIYGIYLFQNRYLVLCGSGNLYCLNNQFELERTISVSEKSVRCLVETDYGFAVGASDNTIYNFDNNFNLISTINSHQDSVFALAFVRNENVLVSSSKDAHIHFHLKNYEVIKIPAHNLHIHTLALNDDQTMLLSGSMDKAIKIWDTNNRNLLKVINADKQEMHRSSVNKILWFGKNEFISCSDDRTIMCFEIHI